MSSEAETASRIGRRFSDGFAGAETLTDSYIQSWRQFLETHHVIPFANSSDAAQKLHILADNNNSPLLAVIYMTSANTNVAFPQSLRDRAADSVHSVTSEATQVVSHALDKLSGGSNKSGPKPVDQPDQPQTVATMFDSLHATVDPGSRDKWLNEKNQPYITALAALSDALQTLPAQVHTDVPLETGQLQQAKTAVSAADAALHSLEGSFGNTSPDINSDLKRLLRNRSTLPGKPWPLLRW